MNSKMLKHLRLATLFFSMFLGIVSSPSLYALAAGNPAAPVLPGINPEQKGWCAFQLCNSYDLFAALAGSFKFGFYGDYIFSESAHITDVPVITSVTTTGTGTNPTITSTTKNVDFDINNSSISSSCVFATIALQETSPASVPLLDIAFTARVGGLKQYYRLPLNAYRDFTSNPLNAESEVTDGLIEVQSDYGIVWDLSLQKVLWKDGVSFVGISADYRHGSSPINYIIVYNKANPEIYFDATDGNLNYKEWSASIGISTYLNDYVLPYASVSVGNTSRKAPSDTFSELEKQFTNFKFKIRKITNFDKINFCCGATCCLADNFYYSIEGRWGYQRAINITSGLQF
ncbi:Outer membrane protein B precursor,Chlamydia major outer membrane protein [Chlamydia serpentis]|uniref:Outer membrane protein B,Chlamydia major outer membrane protein n=1 Tax=Chlamydia serpentis TaxID=1967782 RepID=A0A2R8FCD0_9CHLA|nr:hypothetical protein [Chlamydia serpentis]SPN73966.1 Outer membrane protein B precursor,Chlamydia major outer membrane protein [Chlamydia serpentis]